MTNYSVGHQAEHHAKNYLIEQKYKVIDINWRRRRCEIDIIATKSKTIYFIEVKYRKNELQGTGIDYITSSKYEQMKLAAEIWLAENDWKNQVSLGFIEVSGPDFKITNFIESI